MFVSAVRHIIKFQNYGDISILNVSTVNAPTHEPSIAPTISSLKPTKHPTKHPTKQPSMTSTERCVIFYQIEFFQLYNIHPIFVSFLY